MHAACVQMRIARTHWLKAQRVAATVRAPVRHGCTRPPVTAARPRRCTPTPPQARARVAASPADAVECGVDRARGGQLQHNARRQRRERSPTGLWPTTTRPLYVQAHC
eukprot:6186427-Pleurochrysis_carterae.AAC.3